MSFFVCLFDNSEWNIWLEDFGKNDVLIFYYLYYYFKFICSLFIELKKYIFKVMYGMFYKVGGKRFESYLELYFKF